MRKILYRSDMIQCALCLDAPCSRVCGQIDPAVLLRNIWFGIPAPDARRLVKRHACAPVRYRYNSS